MLTVVIIEDELHAANLLEEMLNDIDPTFNILEKCKDLPEGVKSIKKNSPDLVFLDIELPEYSGIQLLDFFNPEEINFHIIFTTASNEYAIKAFEMSAVDYLMKPIPEEKLIVAIEKIIKKQPVLKNDILPVLKQNLLNESHKKIVVPVANGFEILNIEEILFLKAEGSYTQIFFANNSSMIISKNLKHFEYVLSGSNNFIRIHRSFIANINFAKKIFYADGGMLLLDNKKELPISSERMDKVIQQLKNL